MAHDDPPHLTILKEYLFITPKVQTHDFRYVIIASNQLITGGWIVSQVIKLFESMRSEYVNELSRYIVIAPERGGRQVVKRVAWLKEREARAMALDQRVVVVKIGVNNRFSRVG